MGHNTNNSLYLQTVQKQRRVLKYKNKQSSTFCNHSLQLFWLRDLYDLYIESHFNLLAGKKLQHIMTEMNVKEGISARLQSVPYFLFAKWW